MSKVDELSNYLERISYNLGIEWWGGNFPIDEVMMRIRKLMFKNHRFELVWLSEDLEGFRCKKCGEEFVEIDYSIPYCKIGDDDV